MKIQGFWHILFINNWFCIINSQLRILLYSGLYDACEEITIGCLGSRQERDILQKFVIDIYSKIKIGYFSENITEYEFPTLKLIEQNDSQYVGFYFHTKGVTRPFESIICNWKCYMEEVILNRWQEHRERVENGYDVSSVNYLESPNHFSGNFWWFNRNYISRLPQISTLNHDYRFHAEQYICMGNPNFYSVPHIEPGAAIFKMEYKK